MISSCGKKSPSLELLNSTQLNFPSGSGIEFYNNKLYLFGDDAPYLLVLSTTYRQLDSISYWPGQPERIPKNIKPDIESAMIVQKNGKAVLAGIGSMSDSTRWKVIEYNLSTSRLDTLSYFQRQVHFPLVQQTNVEGTAVVNKTIVLANRANMSTPFNFLLFWGENKSLSTKKLNLPGNRIVAGVSGLYYVKEKDLLLITASEEETASTTLDGAIGESYLGWISNFSAKMNEQELKPDHFRKLNDVNAAFSRQKVESVCVEKVEEKELILHLVADNDNGRSRLFKIRLTL